MKQTEALEILKSGKNVFLTGEPGAGKSHTINLFTQWMQTARRPSPAITASTGIAATHIGGVTIHSWSGIGIKEFFTDSDIQQILKKSYVVRRVLDTTVLIIDEISMINGQTLDNVDRVCREIKAIDSMTNRAKPFGGIQVIFVGDFFQLPPVSKFGRAAKFAFESDAWLQADLQICYLSEQHRQDDADWLEILTAMRSGKITTAHLATLKTRKVKAPKNVTRLFTHNDSVDELNSFELEQLSGEKKTYRMSTTGIPFMIDSLKKNCLSPEILELKVGAPVMFTRNDIQMDGSPGEYVNGTIGVVSEFKDGLPVVQTKSGQIIKLDRRQEWSIEEHGEVKASIKQFPLRLAWAITVHKCQGMSLDAASMDLSSAFEFGQGYVALSRVRSLSGLYLEGLNAKALQMHPTVVKKDGMFRKISEQI